MVQPTARLSPSAARALPFIESGLARGLSSTALQSELSAAGLGVRRTDLLEAIRSIKGMEVAADRLKSVRYDYTVDPSKLPFAVTRQLREYSFRVKVSGLNPLSGAYEDRFYNISSNDLMTRGEIEEVALTHSTNTDNYSAFEPDNAELVSASRR